MVFDIIKCNLYRYRNVYRNSPLNGGTMKKSLIALVMVCAFVAGLHSESVQNAPNLDIIDTPTTNTLLRGMYNFHMRFYEGGGLNTRAWVGFANVFMIGASFDVQNAIGTGNVNGREPKVLAKVRMIEESVAFPAIALGYEPQTIGLTTFPMGIYAAVSKTIMPNVILSGGVNNHNVFTNFVFNDNFGVFAGLVWMPSQDFAFLGEMNDLIQNGRSLNLGIRYAFAPEIRIEFDFKGLSKSATDYARNLRIDYVNYF